MKGYELGIQELYNGMDGALKAHKIDQKYASKLIYL